MSRIRITFLIALFIGVTLMLVQGLNWNLFEKREEVYFSDFLGMLDKNLIHQVNIEGNIITGTSFEQKVFFTISPVDINLIERLREKNVVINVSEAEGTPWYISLLYHWGPFILLIGAWIYFFKKMPSDGGTVGKILSIGKSKAKKIDGKELNITFKDVAGVDESKEDLKEIIDFLRDPEKFKILGGRIPKGVLMVGPPGTGKTLLAKAVAGEAEVPFFSVSGSDFVEMFVGVGASRVRSLFSEGRENAPCIIFVDEIDAVGRHRGAGLGGGHDEREQTLNQILVEMDGFDTESGVIIIAATNRVDILDPALLRPGRFDRQVHVALPDINGRESILKVHALKIRSSKKVDWRVIARGTPGFSGAELANLINESALWAVRNNKRSVGMKELEWARDKVMMGSERKSLIMDDEERKNTAYHEAGHALVSAYVAESDPVHKITIIPRGAALGLTSFLPEDDQLSLNKTALTSRIIISMGGRAAEEIIQSERTTGVEGDLRNATKLAYNMICRWGMSDKLGALTIKNDTGQFLAMDYYQNDIISDDMQKLVDAEVSHLLETCYEKAKSILNTNVDKLHQLADLLLERETITERQFLKLVGTPTPVI